MQPVCNATRAAHALRSDQLFSEQGCTRPKFSIWNWDFPFLFTFWYWYLDLLVSNFRLYQDFWSKWDCDWDYFNVETGLLSFMNQTHQRVLCKPFFGSVPSQRWVPTHLVLTVGRKGVGVREVFWNTQYFFSEKLVIAWKITFKTEVENSRFTNACRKAMPEHVGDRWNPGGQI